MRVPLYAAVIGKIVAAGTGMHAQQQGGVIVVGAGNCFGQRIAYVPMKHLTVSKIATSWARLHQMVDLPLIGDGLLRTECQEACLAKLYVTAVSVEKGVDSCREPVKHWPTLIVDLRLLSGFRFRDTM